MKQDNHDKGYEGFSIYCGGTICVYHKYKWIEWDKRTYRVSEKTRKKVELLKIKRKKAQLKRELMR